MSHVLKSLTLAQRFMLTSLVVLIAGMLGLGEWVGLQIKVGVINRSGATTALYVDSVVAPLLQNLTNSGELELQNAATLSKLLGETSLGQQIVAFKVWDLNGKVIYSTDSATIGTTFPMHSTIIRASQGEVSTRISAADEENAAQRAQYPELLEIYSPIRRTGTNQVIAVAEYYQSLTELQGEIGAAQRRSWLIVGGVMALIYLLLSGFIRSGSRTIENQQWELNLQIDRLTKLLAQNQELNERVRRASAHVTTLNERFLRRTGAELHDGPAQELGLALLQLDSLTAHFEKEEAPADHHLQLQQLGRIQAMLQNTLREMRGIAAGLSLPQLADLNLESTVQRAVQTHERRTGSQVAVTLDSLPESASLPVKIAVYRLVQEALNNAYRHAGGAGQSVQVAGTGDTLSLEVSDRGPGIPSTQTAVDEVHLGLAGMRERVESLGGDFRVQSEAGKGTRIFASLPLQGGLDE